MAVGLALASAGAIGCGASEQRDGYAAGGDDVAVVEADGMFAADSVGDWTRQAHHVAVVRVVAERALPVGDFEARHGEGLVGRRVTMRVELVLWSAPGAPHLPDEFVTSAPGWILHDGERRPFRVHHAPRPTIGERYVMPLFRFYHRGAREWGSLTSDSQAPLVDGRVAAAVDDQDTAIRRQLAGKSVAEIRDLLREV